MEVLRGFVDLLFLAKLIENALREAILWINARGVLCNGFGVGGTTHFQIEFRQRVKRGAQMSQMSSHDATERGRIKF
jgi:hypothetical protein